MTMNLMSNPINVCVSFEKGVSILDGFSGEGKTFLIKLIKSYCKRTGISSIYITCDTGISAESIEKECVNKEVILLDNADLYMTRKLFSYLKSLKNSIVIMSLKRSFLYDSYDCKTYLVCYDNNSITLEEG